jgi:N-acetylmuramoyl-L-alanine amidase
LIVVLAAMLAQGSNLLGQSQPATPLRLLSPGGARVLPSLMVNDLEMIALDDLAPVFSFTVRDDALARAITIAYRGKTIVLTADQSLASVAGRLVSLPAAPARVGNRWYVPAEFIARAIAPLSDTRVELRKASRLVLMGNVRVPRVVMKHEVLQNQARLAVELAPPTPHTVVQEQGRLVIRFEADALDATIPAVQSQGYIQSIRTAETGASLIVELGPRFASFRASDAPVDANNARIVLDVFGATPTTTTTQPPPTPTAEAPPLPTPAPPGLRTIVIDPGHGGDDTGAKGAKGTLEKNVTLSLARRLKVAIESRLGARVILTREDDRTVPLDDRASTANNNKADLFVSLHANASITPRTSGAEVYYLSIDQHVAPEATAGPDSAASMPVFGGGTRSIDVILWETAQARYINQSNSFARMVEGELRGDGVPMSPRAVQAAPMRVLVGANMPAVLLEVGYLTNPGQESQIASGEFQARVTRALLDAIVRLDAESRQAGAVANVAAGTVSR